MYNAGGGRHYFIDEPAKVLDGRLVIPIRWLQTEDGEVWFDAWEVKVNNVRCSFLDDKQMIQTDDNNDKGLSSICDDKTILLPSLKLFQNLLDLEGSHSLPTWAPETIAKGHVTRIPNPDRALADGLPIYTSFIDIFGDDVSGNQSKSWNKHWNIYILHRNLPRQVLYQQCHIHFISTSTHAAVPEQFHGIKDIIK